ncbi:MAG: DnaD domain protein [Acholeplasmataceae bacterium]|jgi:DNA replication protein|nr:DnaD domain protein [Acholeplasmataceae bacterium]MCK9233581.1 DnaD domain protein [Acholeplasmataceae bacterium]MCK9288775.1 DnaD domain protein [Acholeplasmataceae bacterium]MCK9427319.1 DnaD domain protein [Acholeplasmataceae bacterium]MDD4090214.1 DnaD domain protein [Acholeplasmataceae bacterium]
MLIKLFEEGLIDYQKLLFKYHQNFNLTADEYLIMEHLLLLAERKRYNLSTNYLARLSGYKMNQVGEIINSLFEKELITIELERKSEGKLGEIFSLMPFFDKITTLIMEEINKQKEEKTISDQEYIIKELERAFAKPLSPTAFEIVRQWFSEGFSKNEIYEALELTLEHKKTTVNYLDRILRSEAFNETSTIDEKTAEILRKLVGKA